MIKAIVVLYFAIGIIVSIIYTYLDYTIDYKSNVHSIYSYFDNQFSVVMALDIVVGWPFVLIFASFTYVIPGFYMIVIMLLEKIFGGKKND